YLALFLLLVVMPLGAPTMTATLRYSPWWYALYSSNVATALYGWGPGCMAHFWSLCMEEQYYLVWPLLLRFAGTRRSLTVMALLALALTISTRWYLVHAEWMISAPYTFP